MYIEQLSICDYFYNMKSCFPPCSRGRRIDTDKALENLQIAVQTCFWPLFEVEYGKWKRNYKPREKLSVKEWLKTEGRLKHLFKANNEHIIEELLSEVYRRWEAFPSRSGR